MNLLKPPRATPSATAKAITRAGLITRLNELTIDSANATSEPRVRAAMRLPGTVVAVMSPVTSQVTAAETMTRPRVIAVFWTTVSMVMGPDTVVGAEPGVPGVPTDHCDGSVAGWP